MFAISAIGGYHLAWLTPVAFIAFIAVCGYLIECGKAGKWL
jgi:hypothetical protein